VQTYSKFLRLSFILGLILLMLSGCTQTANSQQHPPTHPCQADEVRTMAEWQPVGSDLAGKLTFTGVSAAGCLMSGTPLVQLKDARGQTLPLTQSNLASTTGEAEQITLTTAKRATVYLAWTNWCGPEPDSQLTFLVTLPYATTTTGAAALDSRGFPPSRLPSCQDKTKPSVLTVGAFEAALR
jgi:hypothetical protein